MGKRKKKQSIVILLCNISKGCWVSLEGFILIMNSSSREYDSDSVSLYVHVVCKMMVQAGMLKSPSNFLSYASDGIVCLLHID